METKVEIPKIKELIKKIEENQKKIMKKHHYKCQIANTALGKGSEILKELFEVVQSGTGKIESNKIKQYLNLSKKCEQEKTCNT